MSNNLPKPQQKKKPRFTFLVAFSFLLELTIVIGAGMWVIYGYAPQYYLPLSFLLLAAAGVFAYVIMIKTSSFL